MSGFLSHGSFQNVYNVLGHVPGVVFHTKSAHLFPSKIRTQVNLKLHSNNAAPLVTQLQSAQRLPKLFSEKRHNYVDS